MTRPIQVFLRHCYYSKLQEHPDRKRPSWFNKYKGFQNFKNTIDPKLADYHIVYDEHLGSIKDTFLKDEKDVKIIDVGTECDSFLETLEYIKSKNYSSDTIIYFLEDDYVHRPNWCNMLLEGFTLNPSYVTLYDFDFFLNDNSFYKILTTESSHWRAVPATTQTFACKFSTLLEDFEIHKEYSSTLALKDWQGQPVESGYHFSKDYDKFWKLAEDYGKYLISCMPGYSTHADLNHLSPFVDWSKIINADSSEIHKYFKVSYR
jgi:hypothetical protein